ncbi:hypothetical protein TWF225_001396 [Orbilia oligospora]|uniref:Uncharacterized protein n=1 Tax=Orbilia oligospora TaxID=2813651 RepID=A0A7C8KK83_ORBOL|nr:hypothetical protein TWF751_008933 [Orbilia oligospora]KAF3191244.1 hypothetical protein TWF225_001396 [Orbilia oligospora]KAF3249599.1 hypothetical protein TWF217_008805 [Orbilia oligospora]KAF3269421.1 hypothetical protein TWF128_005653 [Orbilia oligospora]KAF3296675.1 hypothetical protein TWF132_010251 [Orbilia oligospora]
MEDNVYATRNLDIYEIFGILSFGSSDTNTTRLSIGSPRYNSYSFQFEYLDSFKIDWLTAFSVEGFTYRNGKFCPILPQGKFNTDYGSFSGVTGVIFVLQGLMNICKNTNQ